MSKKSTEDVGVDHGSGGFPASPWALDFFARFPLSHEETTETT